jgi:hypothetical protein
MDIFMFQKLDEKTRRINQIWDFDGNVAQLDLSEFDPSELKYEIIKDLEKLAKVELEETKIEMQEQYDILNAEIVLLEDIMARFKKINETLNQALEFVKTLFDEEKANALFEDIKKSSLLEKYKLLRRRIKAELTRQDNKETKTYEEFPDDRSKWFRATRRPYWLDSFDENITSLVDEESKILQPRGISIEDTLAVNNYISDKREEQAKLIDESKKLMSKEYLMQRVQQLELEKAKRQVKNVTLAERVQEFAAMNDTVLFDRRSKPVKMDITKDTGNAIYKKDDKVNVLLKGRKKRGTVLRTIYRNDQLSPMYRVRFAFGNGYRDLILQEEIVPSAAQKKRTKQSATSSKQKEIELFAFAQAQRIRILKLKFKFKTQTA